MSKFIGYFDGSSIPNPGEMKIGGYIIDRETNKVICEYSEELGKGTNNQAEYLSLIKLLELAHENGITSISLKGDSKLVVNQLAKVKPWKCNNFALKVYRDRCKILLNGFSEWDLTHIYRDQNQEADSLTR